MLLAYKSSYKWLPSALIGCLYRSALYLEEVLQSLNVYLLINYKHLKITIFPFKSTAFTFPIPTIC